MKKTKPEYYSPVENLLDLIYEHYTEKEHWGQTPMWSIYRQLKENRQILS